MTRPQRTQRRESYDARSWVCWRTAGDGQTWQAVGHHPTREAAEHQADVINDLGQYFPNHARAIVMPA